MRVFEENSISAAGNILPIEKTVIFSDIKNHTVCNELKNLTIGSAEGLLGKKYPVISATDFLKYNRTGNRAFFEGRYFERRNDMLTLLFAELFETKGRFSDALLDLVWMILDEPTWVIPAHSFTRENGLPYDTGNERDNIDLFAAATAASVAWVYHYADSVLPKYDKTLRERICFELDRRIFTPFMRFDIWSWMGYTLPAHLSRMNNWGPWVSSNILTAVMLCEKDTGNREKYVARILEILDNYLQGFEPDGGCEEGPSYWSHAGGSLLDCLEILYDISGSKIDVFGVPLIRNIGEYVVRTNISGEKIVTFADSHATTWYDYCMITRYGRRTGSDMLEDFGVRGLLRDGRYFNLCADSRPESFTPKENTVGCEHSYRSVKGFVDCGYKPKQRKNTESPDCFLPSISLYTAHSEEKDGVFLAVKGGNNHESHNHNDVGNFIVYFGDKPFLIDAGVGTYTRDTFDGETRYKIWTMQSSYHNLPEVNGVMQEFGEDFRAENFECDKNKRSVSMNIEKAYPQSAGIAFWKRIIGTNGKSVNLSDRFELEKPSRVSFNFMFADKPELCRMGEMSLCDGRRFKFDPSLKCVLEEIPLDDGLTHDWHRDVLYRLTLSAENISKGEFSFTAE